MLIVLISLAWKKNWKINNLVAIWNPDKYILSVKMSHFHLRAMLQYIYLIQAGFNTALIPCSFEETMLFPQSVCGFFFLPLFKDSNNVNMFLSSGASVQNWEYDTGLKRQEPFVLKQHIKSFYLLFSVNFVQWGLFVHRHPNLIKPIIRLLILTHERSRLIVRSSKNNSVKP